MDTTSPSPDPRASELFVADLPRAIQDEVKRSSVAQATYHRLIVRAYKADRSYYGGTPRVLVSLTGVDQDGRELPRGYAVAEVYAGVNGVTSAEFALLWERAA